MKKLVVLACCLLSFTTSYSQVNLQLLGHLSFATTCAGVWQYADSLGNEYALVGAGNGVAIVDVTNPAIPVLKFTVPAASSIWRELKTYSHYCYATTEGGGGVTIVNLEYLPDSVQYKTYTGDGAITGQLNSGHACAITDGYLYVFGSNLANGGALIMNLVNDPWNPQYAGQYNLNYIHDGYIRNDTLWAGEVYSGQFSVIDVTNKANPALIATQQTPGHFCHNTWLSDNGNFLFTTDEVNGAPLGSFDVSDLANIQLADTYLTDSMPNEEVHNVRVLNDFLINPSYGSQVTIVDAARPHNLIEIASYPTGNGLCWDASPYLPSGNILAADEGGGLYIFAPYYVRACYLEGMVTDSITAAPLNNVKVSILPSSVQTQSDLAGNYKTGLPGAGTYSIEFSKPGYVTKTISNVSLNNGMLTQLNVQLVSFVVTGQVVDATSGNPVPNAMVKIESFGNSMTVTSDVAGNFTVNNINSGNVLFTAGKWSYKTKCDYYAVPTPSSIIIQLDNGYYDDFTFDFGWTVTGNATGGIWTRGVPIGTFGAVTFNPDSDVTDDCSDECFVTGNGGVNPVFDDVDNGFTQIASPVFDLSGYTDPYLNYERWFVDASSNPANDDTLFIRLDNGSSNALIEGVHNGVTITSAWVKQGWRITDFIVPTSTMTLTVFIEDKINTPSTLECGFDKFEISEGPLGIHQAGVNYIDVLVYPNPFKDQIEIRNGNMEIKIVELTDITGRIIKQFNVPFSKSSGSILLKPGNIQRGIYLLKIRTKTEVIAKKIFKI